MATALTSLLTRFTDKCNRVLAGGVVKTYEPNSLTPKVSYQDPEGTIPNLPEVVLDESGRAKIYLLGDYRVQVYSNDGVLIEDNLLVEQALVQRDFDNLSNDIQQQVDEAKQAFENTGGLISAPTLTVLQAITPEYDYQLARVDATGDEYRWNPTLTTPVKWEATGRNYIQDAKEYVNENITSPNMLINAGYYNSFFVNIADNKLNSAGNINNVKTSIIKVDANKTYNIKNFNIIDTGAFSIHEAASKSTSDNFPVSRANYTIGTDGSGTVTTAATTQYLYINITFQEYSNEDFSLLSQENPSIFGSELIGVSSTSTTKDAAFGANIASNAVSRVGKVVKLDADEIIDFSTFTLASLKVDQGKTYRFYCNDYLASAFVIAFRASSSTEAGAVYYRKTVDQIKFNADNSFDITVPSDMNYLLYNTYFSSGNFDIRNSVEVNEHLSNVDNISALLGIPIADLYARNILKEISNSNSALKDKKWLAIGDSITDYSFRPYPTYKNFTQQLAEKYGMTVYNYGISGTGFYSRYDVADTITQSESDVDFITVFWGTNDWGNIQYPRPNDKPLGMFGDTATNTIAGCMNQVFSELVAKFPKTPIYVFTPLPRYDAFGLNPPLNSQGYRLTELVALLKQYARQYSMRVLDLYYESNFKVQTSVMKNISTNNGDGVHPTGESHTKLLLLIEDFLSTSAR